MSLRQYLEKIKEEKPINYDEFLKSLPDNYRLSANSFFKTQLISAKPKRWSVRCEPQVFEELWILSETPKNRIHAAKLGNSHKHQVSANLIMVYHKESSDNLCPSVVYISKHDKIQTFQSQKRLLIIENEENFIHHQDFSRVISQFLEKPINIDNTDIALGSGNRVTSDLLLTWYSQYDEVFCAFDYDLGGLQMFKTLKKELGKKASFIQPLEYKKIMKYFNKKPESSNKIIKAKSLAERLGFIELGQVFFETRHFMEQESLLGNYNV